MTSMTTEALPALPAVGSVVSIRPDTSPLRYWTHLGNSLGVHSSYSGTFRPATVTVIRHDTGMSRPIRNLRVTFTDPEGVEQETWMDVTEIAQPGQVPDYSTIDAATDELIRTTGLRRGTGSGMMAGPSSLRANLREPFRAAVRFMVDQYRQGTRWGSEREAGAAFWSRAFILARESGDRGFSTDYSTDSVACEQIGAWLHATILPLVEGMGTVQNLNPVEPHRWERGSDLAIPAFTEDGTLVTVNQVHDDDSVTAWDGAGNVMPFGHSTDLRPITPETRLIVQEQSPDGLGGDITVGSSLYFCGPDNVTRDRRQSILVAREPNSRREQRLGYCTYRYLKADVTPVAPKANPTIEIDGVKYVRLDVVEKDVAHMVSTLHAGSVSNGLCSVYDKVTADVDRGTDFIKMGSRYSTFDVVVEQTITVRRTLRLERQTNEEDARRAAVAQATSYHLSIPGRLDGERVHIVRHDTPVHYVTSPVT